MSAHDLKFKFNMPDDETLAHYISIKGEKGDTGDSGTWGEIGGTLTDQEDLIVALNAKANATDVPTKVSDLMDDRNLVEHSELEIEYVSGEGTTVTLESTQGAHFASFVIKGNLVQDGTPTPNSPVDIEVVTGENTITISDGISAGSAYTLLLGNIELCKVGNYQDYLYKSGGTWYKHKAVAKHTFTSGFLSGGTGSVYYSKAITDYATSSNIPCSKYFSGISNVSGSGAMASAQDNTIAFISTSGETTPRFYIKSSRFSNQGELNTWAASNPLTVYYALADPVDETITDSNLIAQLDYLYNASTVVGTTTISSSQDEGNAKPIFSASAATESILSPATTTARGAVSVGEGLDVSNGGILSISNYGSLQNKIYKFESIAALRAADLEKGDVAATLGYYSAGDGGASVYQIDSTATTIDDGGGTIDLNNGLKAKLIIENNAIRAKQFGAADSNNSDQSSYIINAINYCFNKGISTLDLNGEFFIDSTMEFTSKSNLTIKNGTIYVHETDETLTNNAFNIFKFVNCSNIKLESISAIETNPVARERELQVGGFLFSGCVNCIVTKCYLENLCSGIMLIGNSNNCVISDNYILVNYQSNQFAQSAILNYSAYSNTIHGNKIYGEYYDGVLSIFGGSTKDIIVDSNELYGIIDGTTPLTIVQGITIDQGPVNTIISNNIIKDYFYGIDNKASAKNTKIANNILVGNKISIADREGDSVTNKTFGCTILDNQIIIQKDWDTGTYATYMHLSKYYYVGILSGYQMRAIIKNNNISVFGTLDRPVLGINVRSYNSTNQYIQVSDVSGNNIEFSTGFGNDTSNAPSTSCGIVIYDCPKGLFAHNTFKVDTAGNSYSMFELRGTNQSLNITDNVAKGGSTANHLFITKVDGATITNSTVCDNLLSNFKHDLNLESITNIVEYPSRYETRARRIKTTTLVANSYTSVAKFVMPYAGLIRLKAKGLISSGNSKILDATYAIYVSGTTATPTIVEENNLNIEVQFINDGTSNSCTMQIRSTTAVSSASTIFISDIMATQQLTISDAE